MFRRGVSLLELLVVLVLVSIVAALALPAYRRQMIRVHRSDAMVSLLELQSAEEKFYLRHGAYTSEIPLTGQSERYVLSIAVAGDGQSFVATATPTPAGGQDADLDCLAFSIDAQGRKAVSGRRDARDCWK